MAHAALFGSIAREQGGCDSDVDVLIVPAVSRRLDLFDLGGIQILLDDGFGRVVDLTVESMRRPGLQWAIAQDRVDAF